MKGHAGEGAGTSTRGAYAPTFKNAYGAADSPPSSSHVRVMDEPAVVGHSSLAFPGHFSFSVFQRFSFFSELQIDRVQFPAETGAAETQFDSFAVHGEIAGAGEEGVLRFRPVDWFGRFADAGKR